MSLSMTDIQILQQLQQDARITNQHLADEIGLSASPTWRKVRKLEEDDVNQGYRAVFNRKRLALMLWYLYASPLIATAKPKHANSNKK